MVGNEQVGWGAARTYKMFLYPPASLLQQRRNVFFLLNGYVILTLLTLMLDVKNFFNSVILTAHNVT